MQPVFAPRTSRARISPHLSALVALVALPLAVVLAFWWAPTAVIELEGGGTVPDYDQKIFFLHVPIAFAAYLGFVVGAWNALLYLLKDDPDYDVRSYVGVHVGIVFGCLVLATGAIWARGAWGVWWQWSDRQLLVFLILFLYYCAYFMVRFSLDPGPYRARVSAVFTLLGIVLVPLSFLAVRIAESLIHPTVITSEGLQMTDEMAITFVIGIIGFQALTLWMVQFEVAAKLLAARSRATAASRGATPRQPATVQETHA